MRIQKSQAHAAKSRGGYQARESVLANAAQTAKLVYRNQLLRKVFHHSYVYTQAYLSMRFWNYVVQVFTKEGKRV